MERRFEFCWEGWFEFCSEGWFEFCLEGGSEFCLGGRVRVLVWVLFRFEFCSAKIAPPPLRILGEGFITRARSRGEFSQGGTSGAGEEEGPRKFGAGAGGWGPRSWAMGRARGPGPAGRKGGEARGARGAGEGRARRLRELHAAVRWARPGAGAAGGGGAARDLWPASPGFLVVVPGFLSADECRQLRAAVDTVGLNAASLTDLRPRKDEAYLDRESLAFECAALSRKLWERLEAVVPAIPGRRAVGLSEKLRYYIYRRGQRFDAHVDVSNRGVRPGEATEYTLLVYLNGQECGLQGGDTVFFANKRTELCRVEPQTGLMLLHAHGNRCLLHAGDAVRKGEKYVLRADVMYGPA